MKIQKTVARTPDNRDVAGGGGTVTLGIDKPMRIARYFQFYAELNQKNPLIITTDCQRVSTMPYA